MKGLAIAATLVLAAVSACSFSKSSESISTSVSSPFESSSKSSGGDSDTAYLDDVSDQTKTVVASGGSATDVRSSLGTVAREHGVTDWEGLDSTYIAVGRGLAAAGVADGDLDSFAGQLAKDDRSAGLIRRGYASRTN